MAWADMRRAAFSGLRFGNLQRRRMHRQADHEIAVILVELKLRGRGSVFAHGIDNFRNTGAASFGELQLLEKFADTPVAVATGMSTTDAELLQLHRTIRPRITENRHLRMLNTDLYGFSRIIAAMVYRIDHRLFNGAKRDIFHPGRLGPIPMLDHRFADEIALDIVQGITGHAR